MSSVTNVGVLPSPQSVRGPSESTAEIDAAEVRLGVSLPPSYRRFLLQPQRPAAVGSGGDACSFRRAEELCWGRDDPALREYMAGWDEGVAASGGEEEVSEGVHRATEDTAVFRRAYVEDSLLISHVEDGFLLLNPAVRRHEDTEEWEAWHFANWYPGAARWPAFCAMLSDLQASGDGDESDGDESANVADAPLPMATIAWDSIATSAWDCGGLITSNGRLPGYCDTELEDAVPRERLEAFLGELVRSATQGDDADSLPVWEPLPTRDNGEMGNGLGNGTARVRVWHIAAKPCFRLEVWSGLSGETADDGFAALQAGDLALVAGCALGHPYVLCNLFTFGNSDGSSDWEGVVIDEQDSAELVIKRLAALAVRYCYEQIH